MIFVQNGPPLTWGHQDASGLITGGICVLMLVVEMIAKIRRLSLAGEVDQGDSPGAWDLAEGCSQGAALGRDGVPLRAQASALSEDGAWREKLDGLLSSNASKPQRTSDADPDLRGAAVSAMTAATARWRHAQDWEEQRGSAAAEAYILLSFCARRGLPVRLEPRGRPAGRRDGHLEGGGRGFAIAACLLFAYPRETQEMVFDAHDRAARLPRARTRGIYDVHEDGGGR